MPDNYAPVEYDIAGVCGTCKHDLKDHVFIETVKCKQCTCNIELSKE